MDVAAGATDVPIPRRSLKRYWQKFTVLLGLLGGSVASQGLAPQAFALVEGQPVHSSGDKQIWDRKANQVELFGNAAVSQPGETLTADYIHLDLNSRLLDARGNCVYIASEVVIWGDEMHFNLDTRTGTVVNGRVSNDAFTLRAEHIYKLGPGRFKVKGGEYTTCWDCAASWSLLAEDVDMEINGYAHLSNVTTKIKDTPAFWLPYLIVPIKNRRQTGLLPPTVAFGGFNGGQFTLPFFWAINRSADMTFGLAEYTLRGHRGEWEGRYLVSPRSGGTTHSFYVVDRLFGSNRWAVNIAQTQELPWGFEQKLRLSEVSDNLVPFHFSGDFPNALGEAFLPSKFTLSRATSDWSTFISLNRYRNLLSSDPNGFRAQERDFDSRTVQALPSLTITSNDKSFFDLPLTGGMTLGLTRFSRSAGPFDYDRSRVEFGRPPPAGLPYTPGVDPLREATRLSMTPTLYYTFRPLDVLSLVPSLQYRGYLYSFYGFVPNLYREYLLFQTDLSTQIEKIYNFSDTPDSPRGKHLIRPILTYSYIPYTRESDSQHPFLQQIQFAQNNQLSGYNFDDYDIVPITSTQNTSNYFYPLGNSLAYGVTTQWIRRRGALTSPSPACQNQLELSAGQSINFKELQDRPFSRFFSVFNANFDSLSSQTTYYYAAEA